MKQKKKRKLNKKDGIYKLLFTEPIINHAAIFQEKIQEEISP
jgi:hypothetical protein